MSLFTAQPYFDIVIPLGPNETANIKKQLEYTRKNVIGYRNIYIVTCNTDIELEGCIMVDENVFPFKDYIRDYFMSHYGKTNRNGWYFQQLIKLYASHYIEGILDNYLVVDADVFFLKPISFVVDGKPAFAISTEHHIPYFKHMERLHPELSRITKHSGIVHHMLFTRKYIDELITMVEKHHSLPFWQAFIECVKEHLNHNAYFAESGASEYEIYFNFMAKYHMGDMVIRIIKWGNTHRNAADELEKYSHYDYVSVCSWIWG